MMQSVSAASTLPPASAPPPALLTPVGSTGYGAESSTAMYSQPTDRTGMFSPRSSTRSMSRASAHNAAPSFAGTGASRMSSPPYTHTLLNPIKGDLSQPGVPPDLRVAAASMPSFSEHTHQWPTPHHMPMPMPMPQYTPRPSWDLAVSSYADGSSGSAGAGSGAMGVGEGDEEGVEQNQQQQQRQQQQPHPHSHPHTVAHTASHTRGLQRNLSLGAALPGEQGGVKEGPLHSS